MAHGQASNAISYPTAGRALGREQLGKCHATPLLAKPTRALSDDVARADEVETRRTRRVHKKVRTGCSTCKIRRKKCDETRPACNRCTSTGRRCDGYSSRTDSTNGGTNCSVRQSSPTAHIAFVVPQPVLMADFVIAEDEQESFEVDASLYSSSATSNSHTGRSTPISEALENAEVEAFISGYVGLEGKTIQHTPQTVMPVVQREIFDLPRAPNMFPQAMKLSDLELHCFSQFRFRTGPQFASYFDSSFWRKYCTMFALTHPVVFAAATALGAVHQRYMHGISREAFEYCEHAARLKLKAQKMLDRFRAEYENGSLQRSSCFNTGMVLHDRDIIMASEMLLGLFEGFQDNFDVALDHLKRGLAYMLHRPMKLTYSETIHGPTASTFSGFVAFIQRIKDCAQELFGGPVCVLARRGEGQIMPEVPRCFESLEQTRDYIFTEAEWIVSAPVSIWRDQGSRVSAQKFHVARILRWGVAYANTISKMERTPTQKRCCILMKLLRTALYFLLYLLTDRDMSIETGGPSDEVLHTLTAELAFAQTALWDAVSARDEVLDNMARIEILGDAIIDDKNMFHYLEHSVEFDSAIGPPKANKQLVDSSSKTKHLVKILLDKPMDDVSLWETLGPYCVAERVSAIEEHAILEVGKLLMPSNIKPKWVDVACMLEERRILLRYCYQDESGHGTIWTQQWWEF